MRDGEILAIKDMVGKLHKQTVHNTLVLTQQIGQMNARLAAIQEVCFGSRFSLLKLAFLNIFSPWRVDRLVIAQEKAIIKQMDAYSKELREKQKAEASAAAQKIQVVMPHQTNGLVKA